MIGSDAKFEISGVLTEGTDGYWVGLIVYIGSCVAVTCKSNHAR